MGMVSFRFQTVPVMPDQIKTYLSKEKKQLQELPLQQAGKNAYWGIPTQSKVAYPAGPFWLYFLQNSHIKGLVPNRYYLSVLSCGSDSSCNKAKDQSPIGSLDETNWRNLPPGVVVSAIYLGDINKDNKKDILLKFSNGAGLLYKTVPTETPTAILPSIPKKK